MRAHDPKRSAGGIPQRESPAVVARNVGPVAVVVLNPRAIRAFGISNVSADGCTESPLLVDIGAGTGGWQAPFRDAGWRTIGLDIESTSGTDVIGDVRHLPIACSPDLLVMSPPCTEFARWMLPWLHEPSPDLDLVEACLRVVDRLDPCWWVLENSRGLHQYWRPARANYGAYYLWGEFPPFDVEPSWKGKMQSSGEDPGERAAIPYPLADALRQSVEVWR